MSSSITSIIQTLTFANYINMAHTHRIKYIKRQNNTFMSINLNLTAPSPAYPVPGNLVSNLPLMFPIPIPNYCVGQCP